MKRKKSAPTLSAQQETATTMKYAKKESLVTSMKSQDGHWNCFVCYIDTDAEKVEFVDWLIHKVHTTRLFEVSNEIDVSVPTFPDLSRALYIKMLDEHHIFPTRSVAEKVMLAEMFANGEMDRFFYMRDTEGHGGHVSFQKAEARVPVDVDGAVLALSLVLPTELAEKVVNTAIE